MMEGNQNKLHEADAVTAGAAPRETGLNRGLWLGLAAGFMALMWMSARERPRPERRFADRGQERRNPLHFFLAGSYPHRRRIDQSGARPLFERRQSVYDAY